MEEMIGGGIPQRGSAPIPHLGGGLLGGGGRGVRGEGGDWVWLVVVWFRLLLDLKVHRQHVVLV